MKKKEETKRIGEVKKVRFLDFEFVLRFIMFMFMFMFVFVFF